MEVILNLKGSFILSFIINEKDMRKIILWLLRLSFKNTTQEPLSRYDVATILEFLEVLTFRVQMVESDLENLISALKELLASIQTKDLTMKEKSSYLWFKEQLEEVEREFNHEIEKQFNETISEHKDKKIDFHQEKMQYLSENQL